MRQLTKKEKELTKKGIKRQEKVLEETKRALKYALSKEEYLKAKHKFEDIAQPIEREANKEKFEKELNELTIMFESTEKIIKELNRQLTEGVEEKKVPQGVG